MRHKLFNEIGRLIPISASYNFDSKVVQIDNNNIRTALSKINPTMVDKIIFASELLAEEQSLRLQYNALSLTQTSHELKLSLASLSNIILRSDYLESSNFTKDKLFSKLSSASLSNIILRSNYLESSIESSKLLQPQDSLLTINKLFRNAIEDQYLFEHIKDTIQDVVYKVLKEMENMQDIEETQSLSIPTAFHQLQICIDQIKEIKDFKQHNISVNQNYKYKLQQLIDALYEFKLAVADGITLKYLQCNNKSFAYIAQALAEELQPSEELITLTAIDMQQNLLTKFTSSEEMRGLKFLNASLKNNIYNIIYSNSQLGVGKQLLLIDKEISKLQTSLVIHKEQLMPIKEDIFIFERSAWQTFKTFIANCSKYFIGNTTHCNLYGYGDGVEEIRRAIDNMSSDEVEQTLLAMFNEPNPMF